MADVNFDPSTAEGLVNSFMQAQKPPDPVDQPRDPSQVIPQGVKPGQTVNVVGPRGEVNSLPSEYLNDAFKQGYRIESPAETAMRHEVEANNNFAGSVKQFGKQFVNQALFGVPGIIEDHLADPWTRQVNQKLKDQDQVANALGGIAGFGASLVVGGPLFKAGSEMGQLASTAVGEKLAQAGIEKGSESLAKSLVARTAGAATKLGVEGAVVATPQAVTEAALGDPDAAAESLLIGGGIGAFLGGGGSLLGRGLEGLGVKLTKATAAGEQAATEGHAVSDFFENLRDERAAKALGFSKGQIKKLKGGWDQAKDIANYLFDRTGPDGKPLIGPLSSSSDILDNLNNFQEHASDQIGSVYKKLDEANIAKISAQDLVDTFKEKLGSYYASPLNRDEMTVYQNMIDAIKARGKEDLSFTEAKDLLDEFGKKAFPKGKRPIDPSPAQMGAEDGWHILRDEIDKAADQTVGALGDTNLKDDLLMYRKDYHTSKSAIRALEDQVSSQQGNKLFGLTDTIAGVGSATINPLLAIPTLFAKRAFERYGNQLSANVLDRLKDGIFLADGAMSKVGKRLNEIPGVLDAFGEASGAGFDPAAASTAALARIAGAPNEKDKHEIFATLQQKLPQYVSNPGFLTDHIGEKTANLSKTGAPQVATALSQKALGHIQYLYDSLPKNQAPPSPFYHQPDADHQISASEKAKFARKAEIIDDPFRVLDHLKQGTLTSDHMEALEAGYPLLSQAIKTRVMNAAMSKKPKLSYQKRLGLSLLMGMDIDGTVNPQALVNYQKTYLVSHQGTGANPVGLRAQGLMKLNLSEQAATGPQKMLGKS